MSDYKANQITIVFKDSVEAPGHAEIGVAFDPPITDDADLLGTTQPCVYAALVVVSAILSSFQKSMEGVEDVATPFKGLRALT